MNLLIEFCMNNVANGSQEALEILQKDPDLDVIEYGCLSNCGLCSQTNYAIVEGERIIADQPKELVKKIYEYLEENY